MAAPTQTDANKKGLSMVGIETDEGVTMFAFLGVLIGAGTGTPNGEVTADQGSLFIEVGGPDLYQNTDGGTTWEKVGTQS